MSTPAEPGRGVVHWLTAQTLLFGAMAALLGVVANALFLETFGSGALPVTYILIGIAGVIVSAAIARTAQRFDLVGIAVTVLGGAAVLIALSWVIAAGGDGAWVSALLLVLFPILIQLGFVFIGSQAGRMLDIAGIKAKFGRIMTGFPVGAVVGGVVAGPLVGLLGRTEGLLLVTALVQAAFAALVWATGRRYRALLAVEPGGQAGPAHAGAAPDPSSIRRLLANPFVRLILVYQVLSALGSQLSDFLVFDRAVVQYPDAEALAGFVAAYTAVMNAVSIAFLFLVAGPLLGRFGLRLGIAANPIVLTGFAAVMVVALGVGGGASVLLLAVVSAARIADIALTDGTTRTSINATYQVLPDRPRLAAQTAVEGMGVPVAIAASGVLILVLNSLPIALVATIVALLVTCAAWTWVSFALYRAYGPALVDALRAERHLDPDARLDATAADAALARDLLVSGAARSVRLGLEVSATLDAHVLGPELAVLADDTRPDVRLAALAGLAVSGDAAARARLGDEVAAAVTSDDPDVRRMAALATVSLDPEQRRSAAPLLDDDAPEVRSAALESVMPGDDFALDAALRGLVDPGTAIAAMGAIGRLGDAAVPILEERLAAPAVGEGSATTRLVRAMTTASAARDAILLRHVDHPDRETGLLVLERLGGAEAGPDGTPRLEAVLRADAAHALRLLAASTSLAPAAGEPEPAADRPLRAALADELVLVRDRVIAIEVARHGRERLGPAITELAAGGSRVALGVEALEVALTPEEAAIVVPLLDPRLESGDRHRRLARALGMPADIPAAVTVLADLVEDPDATWRSPWLRACAIRAADAHGTLDGMDLAPARVLGDPVVDEELAHATAMGRVGSGGRGQE